MRSIAVAQERQPEAAEALQFIRETMQQAGAFTAISGRGLLIVGGTALVASGIAARLNLERWLLVWMAEVVIAGLIAAWTIYRKAQATRTPLFSGPARKVAMGLLPAMAGARRPNRLPTQTFNPKTRRSHRTMGPNP